MDRIINIPIPIEDGWISHQRVITVNLQDVPIGEFCLNLCLLEQGLVEALRVVGKRSLRVLVNKNLDDLRRASISFKPHQIELQLATHELEYWVTFFLKAYRDGRAEVDHIDVEAMTGSDESDEISLVLRVGETVPPMSAEEARRILDSYDA